MTEDYRHKIVNKMFNDVFDLLVERGARLGVLAEVTAISMVTHMRMESKDGVESAYQRLLKAGRS